MATKLSTLLGSSFTGTTGPAGSIEIGTVTSNPGPTTVTNSGTETAAILNFNIAPGDFDWPAAGIAVSTGTGWYTSIQAPTGAIVGTSDVQTLTNKTINLTSNSLATTLSQLNSAISDADVATLTGSETLTNKTLTSPTLTSPILGTPASGNISNCTGSLANCTVDGTIAIGYRNVPWSGAADKTTSYTLATADIGKFVSLGASGAITVPAATFAAGDIISIYNSTASSATITCSAVTTYIGGTNTTKTSVTLATRGVCTVFFYSASVCVITGNVS